MRKSVCRELNMLLERESVKELEEGNVGDGNWLVNVKIEVAGDQ